MDIPEVMEYYLDIALCVLFVIGYVLVVTSIELFLKDEKRVLKRFKHWFFISQGASLLIVLFMMATERNQIPIIGYFFLLAVSYYSGTAVLVGWVVSPEERTRTGKKLLKMSKWVLFICLVLAIGWAIIWRCKLFG